MVRTEMKVKISKTKYGYKEVTLNLTKSLKNSPKYFGRNLVCVDWTHLKWNNYRNYVIWQYSKGF